MLNNKELILGLKNLPLFWHWILRLIFKNLSGDSNIIWIHQEFNIMLQLLLSSRNYTITFENNI